MYKGIVSIIQKYNVLFAYIFSFVIFHIILNLSILEYGSGDLD